MQNQNIVNKAVRRPMWRRVMGSPIVNALAAPHGMSRYLEAVDPLWALDTIRARVVEVIRETDDAVTLVMKPNGNWQGFVPGQYLAITVEIDGVAHTRCYSLSGAPDREQLRITVKRKADGKVSPFINSQIQAGDVLGLSAAGGDFVLPADAPENMLLIAGGSGITPMMSMLRTLLAQSNDKGHQGDITLLYYNNSPADTIFADELDVMQQEHTNFHLLRAYAKSDAGELQGFFSEMHLQATGLSLQDTPAWLCGPEPLMALVEKHYQQNDWQELLHLERFALPGMDAASGDSVDGEIRFRKSERFIEADGRSLLDQAEAAGLTPESGCRMGICHTCTCRKISGAVRDLQTGEISNAPDEDIRICISAPVGDVTLDI